MVCRYSNYIGKDPDVLYAAISIKVLYSFFDWLLNQRRGKGGRKRRGTKLSSSLGTYWKCYRLVYERATGSKIEPQMNRQMHRVSKNLFLRDAAYLTNARVRYYGNWRSCTG